MTRLIYDAVSGGLHWSRRQSVHIAGALFIANNVVIKFDYTHKLDSSPYFLTWAQTWTVSDYVVSSTSPFLTAAFGLAHWSLAVIANGVKALENGRKGTNAISFRRAVLDVESVTP